MRIAWVAATTDSDLYRNATGDELVYVQSGTARWSRVFGALTVGPGDYVVIPTVATHRWRAAPGPLRGSSSNRRGHVRVPAAATSPIAGQFREGAPFSERDLRGPDGPLVSRTARRPRGRAQPRRAVAGSCTRTIRSTSSAGTGASSRRVLDPRLRADRRRPPPAAAGAPDVRGPRLRRLLVRAPPVRLPPRAPSRSPYHHANVDSDEVLFYSAGDFMSRPASASASVRSRTTPPGSSTVRSPAAWRRDGRDRTEEVAVMVDTFAPLGLSDAARQISDANYPWTWAGGPRRDAP